MARHNPATRHIGFKAAAEKAAAGEGEDLKHGEAMIAAAAHKSSAGARKANPRLNKVKGMPKK